MEINASAVKPVQPRPRAAECGQHLIHGTIYAENDELPNHPLGGAHVSVSSGDEVVATMTQDDGSYSAIVGACWRVKGAAQTVLLRITKAGPCTQLSATRSFKFQTMSNDDRVLWREDLIVVQAETLNSCEGVVSGYHTRAFEHAAYPEIESRIPNAIGVVLALVWGVVMLSAVARWATPADLRSCRREQQHPRKQSVVQQSKCPTSFMDINPTQHYAYRRRCGTIDSGAGEYYQSLNMQTNAEERNTVKKRGVRRSESRHRVVRITVHSESDEE
jgi:hypothetical protein